MAHTWMKCGALLATCAIVLGAFESSLYGYSDTHSSERSFNSGQSDIEATSVVSMKPSFINRLQMLHAVAIFSIGLLLMMRVNSLLILAARMLLIGTVCYSASAYGFTIANITCLQWPAAISVLILAAGRLILVEGACAGCSSQPGVACASPQSPTPTVSDQQTNNNR